ncbi:MAG TPA: acyltransferase [Methylomirabilota bacterium]|nr:acyltransferase [Methylomirabilota bacterium]
MSGDDRRLLRHPLRHYARPQWWGAFLASRTAGARGEVRIWKQFLLSLVPGRIGSRLRGMGLGFGRRGRDLRISELTWIRCPENVTLGDHVRINTLVYLDATGGIEIGSYVGIGHGSQVHSTNHHYDDVDVPYYLQGYEHAKVVIEDDVWVGAGSIIVAGVRLGRGTVVAAGSVVTRDTEPYSVVAGVPARLIKYRGRRGPAAGEAPAAAPAGREGSR